MVTLRYFKVRMMESDMEYMLSAFDAERACLAVRSYVMRTTPDIEDDLLPRIYEVRDMLEPAAFLDVLAIPPDRKHVAAAFDRLWGDSYFITVPRYL